MSSKAIKWSARAAGRLEQIADYIALDSPKAAVDVVARIERAVRGLADQPHAGRIGRVADTRELVISSLPYIAV